MDILNHTPQFQPMITISKDPYGGLTSLKAVRVRISIPSLNIERIVTDPQ